MRRLLLTAGPINISHNVRSSMNVDIGARTQEFKNICKSMSSKLNTLSGMEVVPFCGSGTAAIEAAMCSLPKQPISILTNGENSHGNTMVKMAHAFGFDYTKFDSQHPYTNISLQGRYGSLLMVHSETSSCFLNDIGKITTEAKIKGMITVVDASSSFGGCEIDLENVDILIFSSNKCIQGPPGLSFVGLKPQVVTRLREGPSFYLNLLAQRAKWMRDYEFRFTPSTHVVMGTNKALGELIKETIPGRSKRYLKMKKLQLKKLRNKGYILTVKEENSSPTVLMWYLPSNMSYEEFEYELLEKGIVISRSPQDIHSFRLGCFGDITLEEYENALDLFPDLCLGRAVDPISGEPLDSYW